MNIEKANALEQKTGKSPSAEPRIQSLARASAILDVVLAAGDEPARLSQISAELGLNRTTVFNLAESLVLLGFLDRAHERGGYVLGLRNLQLGQAVARQLDVTEIARPSLLKLCRDTGETVNFALPYINSAMIVESYEGSHGVRPTSYAGTIAPYHATACGKALLALMEQSTRAQIYEQVGLPALTPSTITDAGTLEANIAEVIARGYALEREETEIGASCIAMAIRGPFGQPLAAISIAGLTQRMTEGALDSAQALLKAEVAKIGGAIGSQPVERTR